MSIQYAMRHFNSDFNGRPLIVFTDHRPILGAMRAENPQPHDAIAMNAINEIGQWTSDIRYKPGKELLVADWLSRPHDVPIGTAYQSDVCVQTNAETEILPPNSNVKYVPPEATLAALEEVALHVLSPSKLAEDQHLDPEVQAHIAGNKPKNVYL